MRQLVSGPRLAVAVQSAVIRRFKGQKKVEDNQRADRYLHEQLWTNTKTKGVLLHVKINYQGGQQAKSTPRAKKENSSGPT